MTQRRSQSNIAEDVTRKTDRNVLDQYSQYQAYFRFFMVREPLALRRELPDPSEWFVVAETGGSADTQADIDNVEIVSLGSLSKTNGVGLSTVFTFDITQPSSVSVLDSILAAKDQLNISQFLRIPYFLELTFRARDPDSSDPLDWRELSDQRRVWPLLINTTNTRVTSQGSVTSVDARFYPDLAMSHQAQKTREEISITAVTVEEFFTKFAEQMSLPPDDPNQREEKTKLKNDRYEIRLNPALKEAGEEKLEPSDEDDEDRILTTSRAGPAEGFARQVQQLTLLQSSELQRSAAALATQLNIQLAAAEAQLAPGTGGIPVAPSQQEILGQLTEIAQQRQAELDEQPGTITTVHRGQTIENVIIATLLGTRYFQKRLGVNNSSDETCNAETNRDLTEKFKELFRIVPDIQLLPFNSEVGDYEKKYIYEVVPYEASTYMASPQDVGLLPTDVDDYVKRGNLLRAYNYNFTGLNNAVLNLDLNFNFRWNLALAKQAGQTQNPHDEPPEDTETRLDARNSVMSPEGNNPTIRPPAVASGSPSEVLQHANSLTTTGRNIISVLFEQMLTPLGGDLVELDLEIRGDPFWLEPDPMPNTTGTVPSYRVGKPTTVRNNSTTQQTYFLLTTYLPEPYQRETGLIPPPGNSTILAGVYSVRQVVSKFNQGKFTQSLSAIRDIHLNINSIRTDKDGNPVVVRPAEPEPAEPAAEDIEGFGLAARGDGGFIAGAGDV